MKPRLELIDLRTGDRCGPGTGFPGPSPVRTLYIRGSVEGADLPPDTERPGRIARGGRRVDAGELRDNAGTSRAIPPSPAPGEQDAARFLEPTGLPPRVRLIDWIVGAVVGAVMLLILALAGGIGP